MAACGRGVLFCHGAAAHWQATPCEMDAEEAKASQATAAAVARMLPTRDTGMREGSSLRSPQPLRD